MKKGDALYPVILTYRYGGRITMEIPDLAISIPVDDYDEAVELAGYILGNEYMYAVEHGRDFPDPTPDERLQMRNFGEGKPRLVRDREVVYITPDTENIYGEAVWGRMAG